MTEFHAPENYVANIDTLRHQIFFALSQRLLLVAINKIVTVKSNMTSVN